MCQVFMTVYRKRKDVHQQQQLHQPHFFLLHLQEAQEALTGAPRARCQDTRTTRPTATLSPISVMDCHRNSQRSHATATRLRGSTGSSGTGRSGGTRRTKSAYWNASRERRKAARPATGAVQGALEICVLPTPSAEILKQTLTRLYPTTNPGTIQTSGVTRNSS